MLESPWLVSSYDHYAIVRVHVGDWQFICQFLLWTRLRDTRKRCSVALTEWRDAICLTLLVCDRFTEEWSCAIKLRNALWCMWRCSGCIIFRRLDSWQCLFGFCCGLNRVAFEKFVLLLSDERMRGYVGRVILVFVWVYLSFSVNKYTVYYSAGRSELVVCMRVFRLGVKACFVGCLTVFLLEKACVSCSYGGQNVLKGLWASLVHRCCVEIMAVGHAQDYREGERDRGSIVLRWDWRGEHSALVVWDYLMTCSEHVCQWTLQTHSGPVLRLYPIWVLLHRCVGPSLFLALFMLSWTTASVHHVEPTVFVSERSARCCSLWSEMCCIECSLIWFVPCLSIVLCCLLCS